MMPERRRISPLAGIARWSDRLSHRQGLPSCPAFTLIELLVVIVILSLAITVIGASLAGGIRAWEAAYRFDSGQSDTYLGLRVLRRDLMNAIPFHGIPFAGEPDSVTIPSLSLASTADEQQFMEISSVRYVFDREEGVLFKQEWTFPQKGPMGASGGEEIIRNLKSFDFRYLGNEAVGGEWSSTWTHPTNHPAAVEISLETDSDDMITVSSTVVLPSWTKIDEETEE